MGQVFIGTYNLVRLDDGNRSPANAAGFSVKVVGGLIAPRPARPFGIVIVSLEFPDRGGERSQISRFELWETEVFYRLPMYRFSPPDSYFLNSVWNIQFRTNVPGITLEVGDVRP